MSDQSFDRLFLHAYNSILAIYDQRKSVTSYDWLLENSVKLEPDYFLIKTLGRGWHERFLNLICSNHIGRFSLSYLVMKRFVCLFYDSLAPRALESRNWLLDHLKKAPKTMLEWSLVEFFLFMEVWLSQQLGQKHMSFFNEKESLNKMALSIVTNVGLDAINRLSLDHLFNIACYANWLDIIVPQFNVRYPNDFLQLNTMFNDSLNESDKLSSSCRLCIDSANTVLYECDNAGEIVFDLLVVSRLIDLGKQVVMVAKFQPILNDVTISELEELIVSNSIFSDLKKALDSQRLKLIFANDFPMVGKYLPLASNQYRAAYKAADLVILKGQANFQTMPVINHHVLAKRIVYKKPIICSFIAKAPIVQYCLRYSGIRRVSLGDPLITLV